MIGKVVGWIIPTMTSGTSYEVFVHYVLDNPTTWAYDISYNRYGAPLIKAVANTLSRSAHVRGDVIYRFWPPRVQAGIDLTLYALFFYGGVRRWSLPAIARAPQR